MVLKMKDVLNIGLIIADDSEYEKTAAALTGATEELRLLGRPAVALYSSGKGGKPFCLTVVHCGIGKVNAAAAAAALICSGCDVMVSGGLSGSLTDTDAAIVIGDTYAEHDFDLTGLGYRPAEKPGEPYLRHADSRLLKAAQSFFVGALTGTVVSGDSFICSTEERERNVSTFGALACDMEAAAEAAVASAVGLPFISVRCISDKADEAAAASYRDENSSDSGGFFTQLVAFAVSLADNAELGGGL